MSQELLYSSDKGRLLKELEVATTTANRLPALPNPEHVEALHDLFGQVVGLKEEAPPVVKPKSPRMTNNQLKAMKVASTKVETSKDGLMQPVFQIFIKIGDAFKNVFCSSKTKGAETCARKRS
ncbi:MAG: hypothetical protein SGJ27_21460 [Candidatus Melainabacteria bacterium]|nr:hypothetical protein [Candidatus Melainabacteria bacterium]